MKTYRATFLKKNNSKRTMFFVKLEDTPTGFLPSPPTSSVFKRSKTGDRLELVWDIQVGGYRYVNLDRLIPEKINKP